MTAKKKASPELDKPILEKAPVAKAPEYLFNPKKLSGSPGVWKYTENPELIEREVFLQQRAKDFGIKENDIVIVALGPNFKILGI